jgi:hypothetical protein
VPATGLQEPDRPAEAAVDLLVGACYAAYVAGVRMSDEWVDAVVDLVAGGLAAAGRDG